jgi:HupE / UreJ protein
MQDFIFYFKTGWTHIISRDAIDHLLFILALSALYLIRHWKALLILITAFTVGHSITLVCSVYDLFRINTHWVEFAIPCTIIVTAFYNLVRGKTPDLRIPLNYWLALLFGLVHGLGFANTIRFMLADDQHIGIPLLGFNLGLEAGQVIVVAVILLLAQLLVVLLRFPQKWWIRVTSGIALVWAGIFAIERFP